MPLKVAYFTHINIGFVFTSFTDITEVTQNCIFVILNIVKNLAHELGLFLNSFFISGFGTWFSVFPAAGGRIGFVCIIP
jgi:hypothetical protein